MTQYTDAVEYQRRKMAVESWAGQVEYILGQNGYIEKAYNSGLVTREFRDGTFVVVSEEKPMAQLLNEAPGDV
jgi:hypothetical protein